MNPVGRIRGLGAFTLDVLAALGHNAFFFLDLVKNSPSAIRRFYLVIAQIHAIGNYSLIIIVASMFDDPPLILIAGVLGLIGWAWGARVLRAHVLLPAV